MPVLLEREYDISPERLGGVLDEVRCVLEAEATDTHDLKTCLFEALANAWRHSGGNRVFVSIARLPSGYRCSVADDGRGFDVEVMAAHPLPEDDYASHGRGLHIIRSLCDGHLEFSDSGRRVEFRLDPGDGR